MAVLPWRGYPAHGVTGMANSQLARLYSRSQSTIHRALELVRVAILTAFPLVIRPPSRDEVPDVASVFRGVTSGRLPRCVGAVDGTHICCRTPSEEMSGAYYNYKHGMTINMHIMVDGR